MNRRHFLRSLFVGATAALVVRPLESLARVTQAETAPATLLYPWFQTTRISHYTSAEYQAVLAQIMANNPEFLKTYPHAFLLKSNLSP